MDRNQHAGESNPAGEKTGNDFESNRREFLAGLTGTAVVTAFSGAKGLAQAPDRALNVARVAIPSSLTITSENKISALNDGFTPENSFDRSHGVYALHREWPKESGETWVQYEWSEPVNIDRVEVYWAVDHPRPGSLPGSHWPSIHVPKLSNPLLDRD